MRKPVLIIGVFALAACGTDRGAPSGEEIAMEEGAVEATSAVEMGGSYERVDDEGALISSTLNKDGTFTLYTDGELTSTGTWTADAENGTCFTEEGSEETRCSVITELSEEGTMEVTNSEGETYTVTKTS